MMPISFHLVDWKATRIPDESSLAMTKHATDCYLIDAIAIAVLVSFRQFFVTLGYNHNNTKRSRMMEVMRARRQGAKVSQWFDAIRSTAIRRIAGHNSRSVLTATRCDSSRRCTRFSRLLEELVAVAAVKELQARCRLDLQAR